MISLSFSLSFSLHSSPIPEHSHSAHTHQAHWPQWKQTNKARSAAAVQRDKNSVKSVFTLLPDGIAMTRAKLCNSESMMLKDWSSQLSLATHIVSISRGRERSQKALKCWLCFNLEKIFREEQMCVFSLTPQSQEWIFRCTLISNKMRSSQSFLVSTFLYSWSMGHALPLQA